MSGGDAASDEDLAADLLGADDARRVAALELLIAAPRVLTSALTDALIHCLGVPRKLVQRRAADAFRASDADGRPEVVAALRTATRDADPRRRWGAAFALGLLDAVDADVIPVVVEAMAETDGDARWAAASIALACASRFPDVIAAAMLALARTGNAPARKMALYVLRDLAPQPAAAAVMLDALGDREVGVRLAALAALCRLAHAPEGACARVLELVRDDPEAGVRRAAVSALGFVGRGVDAARAAVDGAARSDDPALQRAAEGARRRLAEPFRTAGPSSDGRARS